MVRKISLSFIIGLIFLYCNRYEPGKKFVGKEILIPNELLAYNIGAETAVQYSNRPSLITISGAGCTSCIVHLDEWQEAIHQSSFKQSLNYYFIAEGKPDFYFNANVLEKDFLKIIPIYLDEDSSFRKLNNLSTFAWNRTIILDKKNRVIYYGLINLKDDNVLKNILSNSSE